MATTKWEDALSVANNKFVAINLGTTLADNTMSLVGPTFNNTTGLDMLIWLELTTSDNSALFDTTAPGAGAAAHIYLAKSIAGTNFEQGPATGGAGYEGQRIKSIPIPANTTCPLILVGPFSIGPLHGKFYLDADWNAGSAVLTAEWELNVYTNNPASN